jgi:riboflavin kinase/FMN adenylyltransferase
VISRLRETAREIGGKPIVVTFDPHPQIVLQKPVRNPVRLLSTLNERLQLLEAFGVETVVVIPFTTEFSQIPPERFVREFIVEKVGVSRFLIGYDHVFGKDREGGEEIIRRVGEEVNFGVEKLPAFESNSETVSSTKIRLALRNKDLDTAGDMLGYPYFLQGTVMRGDGRGRRLGVPTANVQPDDPNKLLPGNGVYLVSSEIGGRLVYGMANVGIIYDHSVKVWFLKFIRDERKFESADLFLSQLNDDRFQCYDWIETIEKGGR